MIIGECHQSFIGALGCASPHMTMLYYGYYMGEEGEEVGLKQRVRWLLVRRDGWCLVSVIFVIVLVIIFIVVSSVVVGENNF